MGSTNTYFKELKFMNYIRDDAGELEKSTFICMENVECDASTYMVRMLFPDFKPKTRAHMSGWSELKNFLGKKKEAEIREQIEKIAPILYKKVVQLHHKLYQHLGYTYQDQKLDNYGIRSGQ